MNYFPELLEPPIFRLTQTPGKVLPVMAYMGRLHPKVVPFSGFRYMKRLGLVGQSVVSVGKKAQNDYQMYFMAVKTF